MSEPIEIPDITSNQTLVDIIDEPKFRLKSGLPKTEMIEDFNETLNRFIEKHRLGLDQHQFAKIPEDKP